MFHESLVPENDQDEDRRQPDSAGFLEQRATGAIGSMPRGLTRWKKIAPDIVPRASAARIKRRFVYASGDVTDRLEPEELVAKIREYSGGP